MVMQLQKAAVENTITQINRKIDYGKSIFEVFKCEDCIDRDGCIIEQLLKDSGVTDSGKNRPPFLIDDHIYRTGNKAESLYVVHSGSVRTYVITDDGEEQVMGFYLPGDVLGLDGIGAERHVTSAIALETTTICKLSLAQLDIPHVDHQFLNLMSCQLAREYNQVLMLASKDANGKMASFIMDLSKRYEKHGFSSHLFNLTMRRTDIASYLGLTIETVSRTLKRFQEKGVLEIDRRRVNILDYKSLHEIAGAQVLR